MTAANSLVGTSSGNFFLSSVVALANGNYVVNLPRTSVTGTNLSGAAVWGSGQSGVTGTVTTSNSLYGGADGTVALTNGNYAVVSRSALGVGAVTFGNGSTGIVGAVSAANSLIGSTQGDSIGFSGGYPTVTALTNGNYVVSSADWDNGSIQNAGAVTLCNGTTGMIGTVSPANSLVGSKAFDQVGWGGSVALTNGNYVVRSYLWGNGAQTRAGALTFGNGVTGVTGEVSAANSLVGTSMNDNVGINAITPLPNGNYVVTSFAWNNQGAVTFGNGATGISGPVSTANSIVGSTGDDRVGTLGNNPSIRVFSDSTYAFLSANWDNGGITDAGAVTLGKPNSTVAGPVSAENSVRGSSPGGGPSLVFDYSLTLRYLVAGPTANRSVTVFRYDAPKAVFDFDGDGRSDISVFRPAAGEWWHQRSSDLQVRAAQFGSAADRIVPADFTGDGKTDHAFFRPSTGQWFVLRSDDSSFYAFPFGTSPLVPNGHA